MTLQEAIKSGRPFKLSTWHAWYTMSESGYLVLETNKNNVISLDKVEIMAENWEIEEERIKVSKRDLFEIIKEASGRVIHIDSVGVQSIFKRLGFKE